MGPSSFIVPYGKRIFNNYIISLDGKLHSIPDITFFSQESECKLNKMHETIKDVLIKILLNDLKLIFHFLCFISVFNPLDNNFISKILVIYRATSWCFLGIQLS